MEQEGINSVKGYLNLILKKKVLYVFTAVSIITVFVIASYAMPKKYEAESTVFIEKNVISSLIEGIAITPSMEERLRVLAYTMKSRSLLLKVVEALDIDLDTENQVEIEGIIKGFQENTSVDITSSRKRSDSMDLFIVSYRNKDPKFARDYVNTLVRLYIEGNLSEKRQEAFGANTFLSQQIKYFEDKLDKIDEKIVNFRKEKDIFVAIDENRVVNEIKSSEEKLEELMITKKELEAKRDLIEKNIAKEDLYTVAILGGSSSSISNKIIMLQNRLNELLLNYTENYPEVIRLKAEIELLNERLKSGSTDSYSEGTGSGISTLNPVYQELKEEMSRIKLEIAGIKVREKLLKKLVESKKQYLRDIPAEKKKLADLEREKKTSRQIYEELVLRLGQSEVSKQMEIQDKGATFRIVDPAILPIAPVSPNRIKIILLGIFAGLAGAFGLVFSLDNMDTSVKTIDVLKTLGLPVLAIIPRIHTRDELKNQRGKDVRLYTFAGIFMLCVIGILLIEFIKRGN